MPQISLMTSASQIFLLTCASQIFPTDMSIPIFSLLICACQMFLPICSQKENTHKYCRSSNSQILHSIFHFEKNNLPVEQCLSALLGNGIASFILERRICVVCWTMSALLGNGTTGSKVPVCTMSLTGWGCLELAWIAMSLQIWSTTLPQAEGKRFMPLLTTPLITTNPSSTKTPIAHAGTMLNYSQKKHVKLLKLHVTAITTSTRQYSINPDMTAQTSY